MDVARALIVNADDYGLTPAVSAGVREAHRRGIVTSTTVMVNMPAAAEAIGAAQAECPALGLGVHLVLTAGRPVLPPEAVPSLVRLGDGRSLPRLPVFVAGLEAVNPAEVRAEWRAQIERFIHLADRAPTHLDSHHHSSYLAPRLFGHMLDLAREYGCAIRNLLMPLEVARGILDMPERPGMAEQVLATLTAMLASAPEVRRPDHFEARFFGPSATAATLEAILDGLPEGVTEVMCHPGHADPELARISSYAGYRPHELAALTAPGRRERAAALRVRLINFGDL